MSNIAISLMTDDELNDVNVLYNRIYGTNRSLGHFIWEFCNAPAGKAIYVVAKDTAKGTIIGTQCAIPIWLENDLGERILTAKSEDTLVDPAYRGNNVFEKMYDVLFKECELTGIHYIWGFTSAVKPFRKLGFDTPFNHAQMLLVKRIIPSCSYFSHLNTNNKTKDKLKILGLMLMSKLKSFQNLLSATKTSAYKLVEEPVTDLNELLKTAVNNNYFIAQDKAYLQWRIYQNPYYYKVFTFSFYDENNKLVANFLYNMHKNGVVFLIQAVFNNSLSADVKKKMTIQTEAKLKPYQPIAFRTWSFTTNAVNSNEIAIFKQAGFTFLNRGVAFVWKQLGNNNHKIDSHSLILSRMATQGII